MRWKKQSNVERPEYPKLVAIAATSEEAQDLLAVLLASDPDAALVNGGDRGVYARVHNEAAESAAKQYGESRSFPLA
jgi:3-dehydroquinate dehydratase